MDLMSQAAVYTRKKVGSCRLPSTCDSPSPGRSPQKRTQTAEACGPAQILPLLKGEPNLRQETDSSCTGRLKLVQDSKLNAPSMEELDPNSH
ncbi:hypothetical protein E2C01_069654 [Portunus trituberculatus]|uniref:Uncharacterized protein n=1 Tax=Portunus trituberculatus TaxID=210409 RepID=A0A5B7I055_PORTR|nr:hypothetical protein [Portunus trituberculatus]